MLQVLPEHRVLGRDDKARESLARLAELDACLGRQSVAASLLAYRGASLALRLISRINSRTSWCVSAAEMTTTSGRSSSYRVIAS